MQGACSDEMVRRPSGQRVRLGFQFIGPRLGVGSEGIWALVGLGRLV